MIAMNTENVLMAISPFSIVVLHRKRAKTIRRFTGDFTEAKCGEAWSSNATELIAFVGGCKPDYNHSVMPFAAALRFFAFCLSARSKSLAAHFIG